MGLPQACRRIAHGLAVFSLALVLLGPAWAGSGDLDPSFNPGIGVTRLPMLWGPGYYTDGSNKMLLSGFFTKAGGGDNSGIARLDADGVVDSSFTSPLSPGGQVNSFFLLTPAIADSKILIVGSFSITSGGKTYNNVARLNANGSVDTDFTNSIIAGEGMGAAVQSDGKILVMGGAIAVNDYPGTTYYLLRLCADGTVDTGYPMRSAPGGYVRSASVYNDSPYTDTARFFGSIPRFSDPNRTDYMLVLRSDGSTVVSRIGDEIVNGPILTMAFQGDGTTVIVGSFTQVYGTSMNGVARLVPDWSSLDSTFSKISSGANGFVARVTLDTGNKPVLAGCFDSFNGTPCGNLVRLNYDGSVDGTFNFITGTSKNGTGADDRIWTMFKRGDGTWTIIGAFQSYNGSPRQGLASLAANGTLNPLYASFTAAANLTSPVTVYAIQDSPWGIYIGGNFLGYGGKLHRKVARINFDGTPDQTFKDGPDGNVRSICTQPDGKILIAGHFSTLTGYVPRTSLARLNLDGTVDLSFNPVVTKADGSFPDLYMVDVADGGQIVIGGDFAKIADADHIMRDRSAIALLNPDGSLDTSVSAQISIPGGTNIRVNAGGRMGDTFVIGGYVLYQGSPAGFYTRLTSTGALDPLFGPSSGPAPHINLFDGAVRCGTGMSDDRVVVGGDFTHVHDGQGFNIPQGHIARFTSAGLLDSTFAATPGADKPIHVIQRQEPKDKIFIGGEFTSYNGSVRKYLAQLNPNGSVDASFDPKTGADGLVYAMEWNSYIRRLRIVGGFTHYQDASRPGIAQIFASVGSSGSSLLLLLSE